LSLEHEGYDVEVANTIQAARRRVSEAHPDVVVIDCEGRCKDGLALMRDLKADPATAGTIVIALTGCPGLDGDCKALDAGCDRVMHKERALDVPQELQLLLRGPLGQ
jgi:DNA-binding response OmpR family regulator